MSTSKSTSKSPSSSEGKVSTSTSGPNAKATAKTRDDKGDKWVSKSTSKLDKDGLPVVKKIFGQKSDLEEEEDDGDSSSSWTLLGSKSSRSKTASSDGEADADASTGRDVFTRAGKASAGVMNGKAWSKAG